MLKKIAQWTAIGLIAMCGIVLLGGGKVVSGTLLIVSTYTLLLPLRHRAIRWARIGLLCAALPLVVWNISTTEIPDPSVDVQGMCGVEATPPHTGIQFLDQVLWIASSFVAQAAPS